MSMTKRLIHIKERADHRGFNLRSIVREARQLSRRRRAVPHIQGNKAVVVFSRSSVVFFRFLGFDFLEGE